MGNDKLVSVRERLENLKKNPKQVSMPLDIIPEKESRPLGDGMLTFERVFQQKIEKAIKRIDSVKDRMNSSDMFMNYFYDLKQAENEFLDLLAKAEEKHVEFPENFMKRIESVKSKIRTKIR